MYTAAFNNEQAAIKAVKEGKYEYTRPDDNYTIETRIEGPSRWAYRQLTSSAMPKFY